MRVKILIGDKDNVDFGFPMEMNSEENKKFIKLMESLFKPIETEDVIKFRDWRMGENERIQYTHSWTPAEYEVLLNSSSIEEAVNKLGRSGMSVIIRSGIWEYKYYSWCEKMKKDVKDWNDIETIKEFLKEHKEEILKKNKIRTSTNRIRKIDKKLEEINKEIIELRKKVEEFKGISIGKEAEFDIKELEKDKKLLEKEKLELKILCKK